MKQLLTLLLLIISICTSAQTNSGDILSMKERAATINRLLEDKIQNYSPQPMRKEGVDVWIVISR